MLLHLMLKIFLSDAWLALLIICIVLMLLHLMLKIFLSDAWLAL